MSTTRPNVFILSADALRTDTFETYMTALGERIDGVEFSNAVATANATAHSMPALAAGVYADTTGYGLDESGGVVTLAEQFERSGYTCGLWTDNVLFSAEYNYDRGFVAGNLGNPSFKKKVSMVLNDLDSELLRKGATWTYFNVYKQVSPLFSNGEESYYASASDLNGSVLEYLEGTTDEPLLCWIHYMDTHHPFEPPEEYLQQRQFNEERSRTELADLSQQIIKSERVSEIDGTDVQDIRAAYEAAAEYLNDQLVSFVDALQAGGHYDPARDVLVFTADHGESFGSGEQQMLGHTPTPAFWEDLVRVPLLVSAPQWSAGRIDEQVSLIDLMPTLLQLADLEVPETVEGNAAGSPEGLARGEAYFSAVYVPMMDEMDEADGTGERYVKKYHGVRSSTGWKLFADRIKGGGENDYEERIILSEYDDSEDVRHVSGYPAVTPPSEDELAARWETMEGFLQATWTDVIEDGRNTVDERELKRHLRDLGYVDDI